MLNALYNDINWEGVTSIGFDMDGTLYDEYDFIYQVYSEINHQLIQNEEALSFMLHRWLEKGSSYSYIFDETYKEFSKITISKDLFIQKALEVFRTYIPTLSLTKRNKYLLEYCQNNFNIFLVTDGNKILQERKFISLGLSRYFESSNVILTGKYASEYHKPSNKSLEFLNLDITRSVFFGDRDKDETFALSSKMQFQRVYNMIKVSK